MSETVSTAVADTDDWHTRPIEDVLETLYTDDTGLSHSVARRRLETCGPNRLHAGESVSAVDVFVSQFRDFLVYLLVVAALLSLAVGILPGVEPNYVDAGLILLILLANGIFGFVQDYRAERSMEKLRDLSTPDATVVRDGERHEIDARAVVPGDILVLEQGDAVPADARLLSVTDLETMEAPLTGESTAVSKSTDALGAETPVADRTNMVYMNTTAVAGRATAVVVETGMATEVGGIATQMQETADTQTPFQAEVDELGRRLGVGVGGLIVLVALVQTLFTQSGLVPVLLTAVTLAVAAVPEGLPAVVTLTLALGAQELVEKNALVRRLPVVESLGSVDVILTDKTGTLTENQMTVTRVATATETYDVTGSGLSTDGEFRRDGSTTDIERVAPILRCGAYCNNAEPAPESADAAYYGDPTEVALLVSAAKAGIEPAGERVREIPFTSERKRMTVVVRDDGNTVYSKGAPETIVQRCDRYLVDGTVRELTAETRTAILERTGAFAGDALRVLAFAMDPDPDSDPAAEEGALEENLIFLGLQGMIDPPRPEVEEAVADCRSAGIEVVMATGDNIETAKAIGRQIGFDPSGAMTGTEVESLSDAELRQAVEDVAVFARAAPEHKVRVLEALQDNDHTVAMTGDGVNDAPGVRRADVGIAMGMRGTDVTREASDMVLQDDNFATIRDAVAAGRSIFDNVQQFVNLLLSANTGEVLTVFVGVLVGSALFPTLFAAQAEALILTPVMLLWINLVTDGLPALALGVDPTAPDVLDRDPRGPDDSVIDRRMVVSVLTIGISVTVVGLLTFFTALDAAGSLVVAQTELFAFFVVAEMGLVQVIRSRFGQSPFSNRWLVAAVAISLVLQFLVLYSPLASLFDVVSLSPSAWLSILLAVGVVLSLNYALSLVADRLL